MKLKKYLPLLVATLSIVAWGGGGGSGGGGGVGGGGGDTPPNITGDEIVVAGESTPVFSNISCMNAIITKDGALTLKSSCPQPVVLSNISF